MGTTNLVVEPGKPTLSMTRDFDAPRDLVFRAYTEPELVARWMGPRRLTTEIVEWDVRHGGTWRYLSREADGTAYGFRGVFHGTPTADAIVQTSGVRGATRVPSSSRRRGSRTSPVARAFTRRWRSSRSRSGMAWSRPAWRAG